MDNRLKVFDSNVKVFAFGEFTQMHPVVLFLFKFETVVELVHLYVVGGVSLQNFGENPSV